MTDEMLQSRKLATKRNYASLGQREISQVIPHASVIELQVQGLIWLLALTHCWKKLRARSIAVRRSKTIVAKKVQMRLARSH